MGFTGAPGTLDGGFRMDGYFCRNVKYAEVGDFAPSYPDVPAATADYPLRTYHSLAASGALADRYFQPVIGASNSNQVFFARASFVFQDNQRGLPFAGYTDPTVGDLLDASGVTWGVYLGGLDAGCKPGEIYPFCVDLTDDPFVFSASNHLHDLSQFESDLQGGTLPAFSLVRAIGTASEHPEDVSGGSITAGENLFIKPMLDAINGSPYWRDTLVLITWDEGGGFYDHVPPPMAMADGCALPTTPVWSAGTPGGAGPCQLIDASHLTDGGVVPQIHSDPEYLSTPDHLAGREYYGTRVPLIALGPFARKGAVSHVQLEHSSVVRFVEWNFLGHRSGQLGKRDLHVNNIGSMLQPSLGVPEGLGD
jgi:phospholipase C